MIRIRIKNPKDIQKAKTGTQVGYGLKTTPTRIVPNGSSFDSALPGQSVNSFIKPVSRDQANVEAESGETAVADFDNDGMMEHLKIGGNRHSSGGTPLNVPEGTFIFSDTQKMKLKGDVLKLFGKSNTSKAITPATIAKQYDLNTYKAILQDPASDKYDRDTAELMIQNNQSKLSELALIQEAKKGFPNGIPSIALPLIQPQIEQEQQQQQAQLNEFQLQAEMNQNEQSEFEQPEMPEMPEMPEIPMMRLGGQLSRPPRMAGGGTLYDYLKNNGRGSSAGYNKNRKALAEQLGIKNYTGTADQNMEMLKLLKSNAYVNQPGQDSDVPQQVRTTETGYVTTPVQRSGYGKNQSGKNSRQEQKVMVNANGYGVPAAPSSKTLAEFFANNPNSVKAPSRTYLDKNGVAHVEGQENTGWLDRQTTMDNAGKTPLGYRRGDNPIFGLADMMLNSLEKTGGSLLRTGTGNAQDKWDYINSTLALLPAMARGAGALKNSRFKAPTAPTVAAEPSRISVIRPGELSRPNVVPLQKSRISVFQPGELRQPNIIKPVAQGPGASVTYPSQPQIVPLQPASPGPFVSLPSGNRAPNIVTPISVPAPSAASQLSMFGEQPSLLNFPKKVQNIHKKLMKMEAEYKNGGLVEASNGLWTGDRNQTLDPVTGKMSRNWNASKYGDLNDLSYGIGYNQRDLDPMAMQSWMVKNHPEIVKNVLSKYGNTNQGKGKNIGYSKDWNAASEEDLMTAFADGKAGVRFDEVVNDLRKLNRITPHISTPGKTNIQSPAAPALPGVVPGAMMKVRPELTGEADPLNGEADETDMSSDDNTDQSFNPDKNKTPWWTQDKINLAAAFKNRYNVKKYMPTYVGVNPVLPRATFFDATRQLSANQEQAAQQNMMSAMYAGPQRFRSAGSNIQGQAAQFAANTVGQVNNQNIDVANQNTTQRAGIVNEAIARNASAKKLHLDELATANQQYDNSVNQLESQLPMLLNNGMTNAQKTNWMNRTNTQYNIDPKNGYLNFIKGRNLFLTGKAGGSDSDIGAFKKAYDSHFAIYKDKAAANAFAMRQTSMKSKFNTDNEGNTEYGVSGSGMNPLNYLPSASGMPFR